MKRTLKSILAVVVVVATLISCAPRQIDRTIRIQSPSRPAGQKDVIGLTNEPMDVVRIGFVGLGMRGADAVNRYTYVPGIEIKAVCDLENEKVERVQQNLVARNFPEAAGYGGEEESWKQLCDRDDIDLVYICTDWKHHTPIALYAMEHGKHVAIEVPAAQSMKEIWDLINASEKTRKHCIMLENCCYDFFELTALEMSRQGVFGELIHGQGSYHHNLDPYWDAYWNNWRLDFNQEHRGDVYPTHGLGPVCQAFNIHRGDRLKTLVAMDTDPFNGPKHVESHTGQPCENFENGDVTNTLLRTEKGKTILIQHDVMTPRPYDRMYQLVGTDGYAGKYPVQQICVREEALNDQEVKYDQLGGERVLMGAELQEMMSRYRSPILTPELEELAKHVGGHGGMDFIMDYRLIYCMRKGLPLDMDVYDLAEWCCLGELGRISIENGNAPVEIPDFTRGAWDKVDGFHYAL